jgi:hypothetical protein
VLPLSVTVLNHPLPSIFLNSTIRPAFIDITSFALPTNMRRRQSADSSSLDEYEPTDTEADYYSDSETEFTSIDNDVCEVNVVDNVEGAKEQVDCTYLFANEVHPPEYYLKLIKEFNESEFIIEDYSKGSTRLLDRIEEQWY